MTKEIKGLFTEIDGQAVYKIENYDQMENFFMTITSASDNWNFCWSWGGLTAGRIDSNHAIFPYYTADKVSDAAPYTGNYTCLCVNGTYWEPFTSLHNSPAIRKQAEKNIQRNIYKNYNGTQVWFEEINTELNLSFVTSWTSSDKYGIVRKSIIRNHGNAAVAVSVIDGCQNILPACCTSDFQNNNSILLDAYKKTDLDTKTNLAIFSVSSVVSDKAEPNEGLYANVSWFSVENKVILDTEAPVAFVNGKTIEYPEVSKGKRSSCFIKNDFVLEGNKCEEWYQVFDTALTMPKIKELQEQLKNRALLVKNLIEDIKLGNEIMTQYLMDADGVQNSADLMACLHHQQNVMFNIMRGGILANKGRVQIKDFMDFVTQRNSAVLKTAESVIGAAAKTGESMNYDEFATLIQNVNDPQLTRLFLEYIPLTFSRRHGDPSRPWNVFNIKLKTSNGEPILNYEGNWRDIFQNWEALAWSYPMYIKNMCAKFLNAMTIEGFNPYKINRKGIDWEIPDPTNPWAQYGYWGDHQVIYFEKLLEFYEKTNRKELLSSLNEKIYTSSNVPYRLKTYDQIEENPRSTITFDAELNKKLMAETETKGSDAKLVQDENGNPALVSFTTKVLQIVISKIANLVPAGGIWLNTQRPEWNDANNALAGYGLSVVTLCYLYRYINFLEKLYASTSIKTVTLPDVVYKCFAELGELYKSTTPAKSAATPKDRKAFVEKAGKIYEAERDVLYRNGYVGVEIDIDVSKVQEILCEFKKHVEYSIKVNKREDNLYHSYNTLKITDAGMEVEYLQEMLEGQVAVLSSDLLTFADVEKLLTALESSKMYESRQKSFMLYPNKELPAFCDKNNIAAADMAGLENLAAKTGTTYFEKDAEGDYHFNPDFRNANLLKAFMAKQTGDAKPTDAEQKTMLNLYEKTFNHQSFTGRSGTFYAYEGLGSIYWHMVSKLLLAVQENLFKAYKEDDAETAMALTKSYFKVRDGLSYKKTPEIYGAFPQDPYSHTPFGQGAKQPGMTGQVKEEILTRWGELGLFIEDGKVVFNPILLQKAEIKEDGTLTFGWCGIPVTYKFTKDKETYITVGSERRKGNELTQAEAKDIFMRNGKINGIQVEFSSAYQAL